MKTLQCDRCAGEGKIWFSTLMGGVCFSCNGTGLKHTQKRTTVLTPSWRVDVDDQRGLQQFKSRELAQEHCDAVSEIYGAGAATIVEFVKTSYTYKRVKIVKKC
jgi:DnaJ-class molecular chaperone